MRRFLLAVFFAATLCAQGVAVRRRVVAAPPSYLYHETFEGTAACGWGGYTNCDVTPYYGENAVANYATSPAPIQGAKSLKVGAVSDDLHQNFTASNEVYASVMFNFSALPSADVPILAIRNSAAGNLCTLTSYANNFVVVKNTGGTQKNLSVTMSTGTTYYAKLRAKIGTGANAECQGWFSTNGTTWSDSGTSNDGTFTTQPSRVVIMGYAGSTNIFDDIRVAISDINY